MSPQQAATAIRDALPPGGLFAGHEWRIAPGPFPLRAELVEEIESLGRVLLQFYRAVNLLYRKSVEGKMPAWVAEWLDRGKPAELVALQRLPFLKNEIPRVIRPDLLITEHGLSVTELDSVPGGIGLTAWLNQVYGRLSPSEDQSPIIGGADGMIRAFASIFGNAPRVHIVVSEEAATYRPEMRWLCEQMNQRGGSTWNLQSATYDHFADGDAVYRFFELFDLPNVPSANRLFELAALRRIRLTPPPKPMFEEKMLFALLWNQNLRGFWRQELGEGFFNRLKKLVPYTWIVDPTPLPPQAVFPELNLTDWRELKSLSQKQRELILKVSGFSARAWGARGVYLGSDLSHADWAAAVDEAIQQFDQSPRVLQRFDKPGLVEATWFDFRDDATVPMKGRARLCPYYFVVGDGDMARVQLGGVLATICPADKKIIHGMKEAIMTPCVVSEQDTARSRGQ